MSLREESVIAGPFLSLWPAKAIGRLLPCPSSLPVVPIWRDRVKIGRPSSQCANQIIRETVESGGTHARTWNGRLLAQVDAANVQGDQYERAAEHVICFRDERSVASFVKRRSDFRDAERRVAIVNEFRTDRRAA